MKRRILYKIDRYLINNDNSLCGHCQFLAPYDSCSLFETTLFKTSNNFYKRDEQCIKKEKETKLYSLFSEEKLSNNILIICDIHFYNDYCSYNCPFHSYYTPDNNNSTCILFSDTKYLNRSNNCIKCEEEYNKLGKK